ncbi:MAG: S8 family serine peptidase [Pirellulales bacterium]|nr:S8 family serine peptidase [Pirellulales bacterium]
MRSKPTRKTSRQGRIESLEPRVVMSADPLADLLGGGVVHHAIDDEAPSLVQHVEGSIPDFWITAEDRALLESSFDGIEQMLVQAHQQTGWNTVQANYGFTGSGQTVAVIDSGIAYDHYALGGGLGSNYRVVGGWDFTEENDANPYDDGASGSHGTHVAGIIGSTDATHRGVAPGVDLVALRVFNDVGAGYFSWVENALRWVYANRNSFANPITAVNLSLGVSSWNAESIPAWANLEDEFAQLESVGIFVAVSAGNSFTSYNTTGLSYPAASQYVVPVMSTDDSGLLSYYSQRSTRAIAAPGRSIISTVPDYAGNNNGVADDFKTMSGTSMAAPYVAGASTLVRQAMQFVGMTGITQDMIYDHIMATADSFVDSATGATFKRLNLSRAIDALMPTDDFGSTMGTAYGLGTVAGSMTMNGVISTLSDVDYFRFTAGATGTVTFNATSTTHDMSPLWNAYNAQGATLLSASTSSATFQVVAGQQYTVGLSSSGGLGYYNFSITAQATFNPVDWGVVTFNQNADQVVSGESWYRVTASQAGLLTAQAAFAPNGGDVTLQFYDTNQQLIATGTTAGTTARVDVNATAGQQFLLRVVGTNSDVDFTLANLVRQVGSTVSVTGTAGADAVAFSAGSSYYVTVNGIGYGFSAGAVSQFQFDGGGGVDSLSLFGSSGAETVNLRLGQTQMTGTNYSVVAVNYENVTAYGGGGNDLANFYDTAGDDQFTASPYNGTMTGSGYSHSAQQFARIEAFATFGNDAALLADSAGDDVFVARPDWGQLRGAANDYSLMARGFDRVEATSTAGGLDLAYLYDGVTNDILVARPDYAQLRGANNQFNNQATGFDRVYAYGTAGGLDQAYMYDSAADDFMISRPDYSLMRSANTNAYYNYIAGFERVYAYATAGGNDLSYFYDSAGDDLFIARPDFALMRSVNDQYYNYSSGFERVFAYASTGNDLAYLYDSSGDDLFVARPDFGLLRSVDARFYNYAGGFDRVHAYASTGFDTATLYDGATDDIFVARPDFGLMRSVGSEFYNYASGFDRVFGYSTAGGNDTALMYDGAGNDRFYGAADYALMHGESNQYYNRAQGFRTTTVYASTGNDLAWLYDSTGNDALTVRDWGVSLLFGGGKRIELRGFKGVTASSLSGGLDTTDVAAVDWLFSSVGNWA